MTDKVDDGVVNETEESNSTKLDLTSYVSSRVLRVVVILSAVLILFAVVIVASLGIYIVKTR